MFEPQHLLPRYRRANFRSSGHAVRSWVRRNAITRCEAVFTYHRLSSGGNRGSGSSWLYDGGAFVQRSMTMGKPVVLVTIKYVRMFIRAFDVFLSATQLPSRSTRVRRESSPERG